MTLEEAKVILTNFSVQSDTAQAKLDEAMANVRPEAYFVLRCRVFEMHHVNAWDGPRAGNMPLL